MNALIAYLSVVLFSRAAKLDASSGVVRLHHGSHGYFVYLFLGKSRSGVFLVDTGGFHSFLTNKGARLMYEAGAHLNTNHSISVEGAKLGNIPCAKLNFYYNAFANKALKNDYSGTLGLDFLSKYTVSFNFNEGVIRLSPNRDGGRTQSTLHIAGKGQFSCPLTRGKDGTFYVPIRIGNVVAPLCADTGSQISYISDAMGKGLRLERITSRNNLAFTDKNLRVDYYALKTLRLGGRDIRGYFVLGVAQHGGENQNILGINVLSSINPTFDFYNRKMYFDLKKIAVTNH